MIEFNNVTKIYDDGTTALDDVSFTIPKNESMTLVGPSGCGKTTTMKTINRLIEPTSGDVVVDGTPVTDSDAIELRRSIGYVIQEIGLFSHMTVEENIGIVPDIIGWDDERIEARVDELMKLIQLPDETRTKYPNGLSGGQRQRVGVARALAAEPKVLLMDEPFGALDPITRADLQEEFIDIKSNLDVTIVFVTHDIDEALKMGDTVTVMRDGQVVQSCSPPELLANPTNEFVSNFLGEDRLLKQLDSVTVADVMSDDSPPRSSDVPTLPVSATLKEAMQLFLAASVTDIHVIDDGRIVGRLRESDLKAAATAGNLNSQRREVANSD